AVQRVLLVTLALNILVCAIKVVVGITARSLSLLADALHSLTDSASNILALVAMRFALPEPDADHPYGHSKFESVGALGIAAFLGVACFEILRAAVGRLFATEPIPDLRVTDTSLQFTIAVLLVNIFVTVYEHRRGQALNSRILLADARHTLSDIWITIAVLFGLWGAQQGWVWLDNVLAFPVAGLVFWSAWQVLQENLPLLTDQVAIAPEAIRDIAMQVPGVLNCHDITSRGVVGQTVFVEMHMVVEPQDITTAHGITEAVEERLSDRFGRVRATIHLEPYDYIEPFSPVPSQSEVERSQASKH
ncbi:MAG: cation diffusion facilitator family transporter, partial [Cyanobacteria bacterium J06648_11]